PAPLSERVRPATECRLDLRPSAPAAEQRVRHIPSGKPAVIYTFGPVHAMTDGAMKIEFTWFGAHHYSGRYRCVVERRDTGWQTRNCTETTNPRGVGLLSLTFGEGHTGSDGA